MTIDHPRGLIAQLISDAGVASQKAHEIADEIVRAYAELNAPRSGSIDVDGSIRCLSCGGIYSRPPRDWKCWSCGGSVNQNIGTMHVSSAPQPPRDWL